MTLPFRFESLKYRNVLTLFLFFVLAFSLAGCRRVTLVTNSLVKGQCLEEVESAINGNNGESWVYTKYNWGGSKAYNNPINREIYSKGPRRAFGYPDVTVLSFGSNEMIAVQNDHISFESAVQSMQTLINQSVAAGSSCVVIFEASHHASGLPEAEPLFSMHMDDWFDHWHSQVGEREYLAIPYRLLIADISDAIHENPTQYLADALHLNHEGAKLAAAAILEQVNNCPEGRWIFGENSLKEEASFPQNPYLSYPWGKSR
jgi:lysophospholipase L1-like esterase